MWDATRKSYELFARYVLPRFEERSAWRSQSMDWMRANNEAFSAKRKSATAKAVEKHFAAAGKPGLRQGGSFDCALRASLRMRCLLHFLLTLSGA